MEQIMQPMRQQFYETARQAVGGLYVWGGQGHRATEAYIKRRAKAYPQYFSGGRLEMMLRRAEESALFCWDCSGLVCWALTKIGAQGDGFDTTANGLYTNFCVHISEKELQTGDLLFKQSGSRMTHVGVYGVEGCIEAAGGAYGVVLCPGLTGTLHRAKNLVDGKTYQLPDWTHYGRLSCFNERERPSEPGMPAFGLITGNVYLRTAPSSKSVPKGVLRRGSRIVVMPAESGWRQAAAFLNGAVTGGYVSENYVEVKSI